MDGGAVARLTVVEGCEGGASMDSECGREGGLMLVVFDDVCVDGLSSIEGRLRRRGGRRRMSRRRSSKSAMALLTKGASEGSSLST